MSVMVNTKKFSDMLEKNSDPKSRYTKIKELGKGSFGNVWLVRSNYSFRTYVKKEMNERCRDEKERDIALNEAHILARLKHKNIIRYKDAYFDDGRLCIVMEYADDGDLYTKIKKQNGRRFHSNQILDWFVQLVMAVKYIHDQSILHRDLKSQNIFLTVMGILKVGDFGISRLLECTADHAKTVIGTPYYLSPEICQREPYNQKSDIWSLGVILYEMTMLTYPFVGKTLSELVANILVGKYAPVDSRMNPLICDLVLILLQLNASDRPSANDILGIPAIASIMRNIVNRTNELEKNIRKESLSSPLIERKRDKSFKYDVIFDLTLNHNVNDITSDGCKKPSESSTDLDDVTDSDTCKSNNFNGKRLTCSSTPIDSPKVPTITPDKALVNCPAPIFAMIEDSEEGATIYTRKRSDISRKRTFKLDREAVDSARYGKSRRSCDIVKMHKYAEDDVAGIFSENLNDPFDGQEPNALDKNSYKQHWHDTVTNDIVGNLQGADTKISSHVESVGPVTDYSSLLDRFTEKESSISKKSLCSFESNRKSGESVSKRGITSVGNTFSITELSPKIKAKVLDRVRKYSSKNMEQNVKADIEEDEKSLSLGSCRNQPGCARMFEEPSCVKELGKTYRKTKGSFEKDFKRESAAKDVLVFVDDEEFFLIEDHKLLCPNTIYQEKASVNQSSKHVENENKTIRRSHKRMNKLKYILENRIGMDKLKSVSNFLRKRKLVLLQDDVLSSVNEILGEDMDNLLPVVFELLFLEKRLAQISSIL